MDESSVMAFLLIIGFLSFWGYIAKLQGEPRGMFPSTFWIGFFFPFIGNFALLFVPNKKEEIRLLNEILDELKKQNK